MCHMCINETFNSYMVLNNVIGSIHHYHNIQCVIVCQSSLYNVFCVPYLLDQTPCMATIYFAHQFCAASIRECMLTIQEQHLFHSANPFTDIEESKVAHLLDRQGNLLVVADWFTSLF